MLCVPVYSCFMELNFKICKVIFDYIYLWYQHTLSLLKWCHGDQTLALSAWQAEFWVCVSAVQWRTVTEESRRGGATWLAGLQGGSASGVPAVLKTKQDKLRLVSVQTQWVFPRVLNGIKIAPCAPRPRCVSRIWTACFVVSRRKREMRLCPCAELTCELLLCNTGWSEHADTTASLCCCCAALTLHSFAVAFITSDKMCCKSLLPPPLFFVLLMTCKCS